MIVLLTPSQFGSCCLLGFIIIVTMLLGWGGIEFLKWLLNKWNM